MQVVQQTQKKRRRRRYVPEYYNFSIPGLKVVIPDSGSAFVWLAIFFLLAYPLGVSNGFAAQQSAHGRRDGCRSAIDDVLRSSPVDPVGLVRVGILAAGGQEPIIEDAVGLVRLVEGVIDQSVGDFAQAPPAGPSRFARIVGHIHSGRLVVPALAPQPIDDRRAATATVGRIVQRLLIQTIGTTPPRRPDEQSKFTDGFVPLLLLLCLCLLLLITVLIRRKRQNTTDLLSTTLHHHIQLTGGFRVCQSRMVHDVPKFQSREKKKKSNRSVRMRGGSTTATEKKTKPTL